MKKPKPARLDRTNEALKTDSSQGSDDQLPLKLLLARTQAEVDPRASEQERQEELRKYEVL